MSQYSPDFSQRQFPRLDGGLKEKPAEYVGRPSNLYGMVADEYPTRGVEENYSFSEHGDTTRLVDDSPEAPERGETQSEQASESKSESRSGGHSGGRSSGQSGRRSSGRGSARSVNPGASGGANAASGAMQASVSTIQAAASTVAAVTVAAVYVIMLNIGVTPDTPLANALSFSTSINNPDAITLQATLYSDAGAIVDTLEFVDVPYLRFDGLTENTEYTLVIANPETGEELYRKRYCTAATDPYRAEVSRATVSDGELSFAVKVDGLERSAFYTVSVVSSDGRSVYASDSADPTLSVSVPVGEDVAEAYYIRVNVNGAVFQYEVEGEKALRDNAEADDSEAEDAETEESADDMEDAEELTTEETDAEELPPEETPSEEEQPEETPPEETKPEDTSPEASEDTKPQDTEAENSVTKKSQSKNRSSSSNRSSGNSWSGYGGPGGFTDSFAPTDAAQDVTPTEEAAAEETAEEAEASEEEETAEEETPEEETPEEEEEETPEEEEETPEEEEETAEEEEVTDEETAEEDETTPEDETQAQETPSEEAQADATQSETTPDGAQSQTTPDGAQSQTTTNGAQSQTTTNGAQSGTTTNGAQSGTTKPSGAQSGTSKLHSSSSSSSSSSKSSDGSGVVFQDLPNAYKSGANKYSGGTMVWTWAEDNDSATATIISDDEDPVTLPATIVTTRREATCTRDGAIIRTAIVTAPDGNQYKDTKTTSIPATGHDFTEMDGASANETRYQCTRCGAEIKVQILIEEIT